MEQLKDLEFVDDVCLLSENGLPMQKKLHKLVDQTAGVSMKINKPKTVILNIIVNIKKLN